MRCMVTAYLTTFWPISPFSLHKVIAALTATLAKAMVANNFNG